ncbi:MAG: hypothetical protein WBE94_21705, partial [Pseudolabrys sp.]
FTTTKPARTWDWARTHRDDALSNDADGSSQRQFCADCIIATPGYDFQEGQVYSIDAMAVIYMVMVMSVLLVALRFVRPTQMVFRLDQTRR